MLAARQGGRRPVQASPVATPVTGVANPEAAGAIKLDVRPNDPRIQSIRDHLEKYRSRTAQGKLSEAGRELEAVESLVK